jgi:hypothetical protein
MVLKYLLVASLVTVAGCSTFWKGKSSTSQSAAASGSTTPSGQPVPQPPSKSILPDWMTSKSDQPGAKTPPMASSRKINEQSCTTGGVDLTAGNLRCK